MKQFFLFILGLSLFLITFTSNAEELQSLFDQEWQYRLVQSPLLARSMGKTVSTVSLDDISSETLKKNALFYSSLLEKLQQIDVTTLEPEQQVNYQIFKDQTDNQIAYYRYAMYQMPFNSDSGFYSAFARAKSQFNFSNVSDYEDYLDYLTSWGQHVEQQIKHMQMGLDRGFTQPRIILTNLPERVFSYVAENAEQSVFYQPFNNLPDYLSTEEKTQLREKAAQVIKNTVNTGYIKLGEFFKEVYLPNARTVIAATALPQGKAFYQDRIRHYTTLDMNAGEIHQLGLDEVARIRAEMEQVIESTGFKGDFQAFITYLRTDPKFYAKTEEELLEKASRIAKRMDAKLPSLFLHLPRTPYGVEPVPKEIAPNYTTGRYVSSPRGSKQPGYYWVNTYALDKRPLYELEALTLHEAVPGHHLQISLNQELDNLPAFRQYSYLSAFGEGWGLYSEWLGLEAGFYQDPYANFGRLTYEMWRAVRLVVDTGMHAMGWSRDKAQAYLANNTALSLHNVNTEIDRYISWPAQALSYKIGELTIKRLRKTAEQQLGQLFDVREFHDVVLRNGSIPLHVLEQNVTAYINQILNQADTK